MHCWSRPTEPAHQFLVEFLLSTAGRMRSSTALSSSSSAVTGVPCSTPRWNCRMCAGGTASLTTGAVVGALSGTSAASLPAAALTAAFLAGLLTDLPFVLDFATAFASAFGFVLAFGFGFGFPGAFAISDFGSMSPEWNQWLVAGTKS